MRTTPTVQHHARRYTVLATFPADDPAAANRFLENHPEAAVLTIAGGGIVIVDRRDPGRPCVDADTSTIAG